MIDFFIKSNPVYVDCFTASSSAFNNFKIDKAVKFLPEWFKKMPSNFDMHSDWVGSVSRPTIKRCPGIASQYRSSYALPLWSDLIIQAQSDGYGYVFADEQSRIVSHNDGQFPNVITDKYHHLKIASPWLLKTKHKTLFLMSPLFWNSFDGKMPQDILIPSGVLPFYNQRDTNVNLFVKKENTRHELSAGTPLVQITPMTEREVILRHHLVSFQEAKQIQEATSVHCFFKTGLKKCEKFNG